MNSIVLLNVESITKIKREMITAATITTNALLWSSLHVGHDTLLKSSSVDSSMYVLIFDISYSFCTGGETRTPSQWFWRPLLYQLSYTRRPIIIKSRKVSRMRDTFLAINQISYYTKISVTCPAPTVLPPSLIANLKPLFKAIGAINFTVIETLSPGITISLPSSKKISPVTSVVLT
jgi:hypothetical protein